VAEINLHRHQITMETVKSGRKVQGVKSGMKTRLVPVKRELGSPKTGRKARRDGTVEATAPTFHA
jgi:hypothetical protein